MSKQEEILTIAGERVRVEYCADDEVANCCDKCCFCNGGECDGIGEDDRWPCEKFDLSAAYFVPAEKPKPATIAEEVPAEGTEADLEAEIDSYWKKVTGYQPPFAVLKLKMKDVAKIARHFAEWGAEHLKK